MEEIIEMLHRGGYSCVIKNGEIRRFSQRGVADLHSLLSNDADFLKGALIADKVVGKAAAALMILGGVKELYTDTISTLALDILAHSDLKISYNEEVPFIYNRDNSDWCPLEKKCLGADSPKEILFLIEEFIRRK